MRLDNGNTRGRRLYVYASACATAFMLVGMFWVLVSPPPPELMLHGYFWAFIVTVISWRIGLWLYYGDAPSLLSEQRSRDLLQRAFVLLRIFYVVTAILIFLDVERAMWFGMFAIGYAYASWVLLWLVVGRLRLSLIRYFFAPRWSDWASAKPSKDGNHGNYMV